MEYRRCPKTRPEIPPPMMITLRLSCWGLRHSVDVEELELEAEEIEGLVEEAMVEGNSNTGGSNLLEGFMKLNASTGDNS